MQLLSVNVGVRQPIASKSGFSGIFKQPQAGLVEIGPLGLAGDAIVDTDHHGGETQAVYVYFQRDYEWWSGKLGRDLAPATFGENLLLSDLESTDMHIGDRLVFDVVVLEVTYPRVPCATLAARMDDKGFVRRFFRAGRPGVYCRVVQAGAVAAGQSFRHVPAPEPRVPANELLKGYAALGE